MHPTGCWQGSGRDELIGLFHPLCFKSSACSGPYTYPLLLVAESCRISLPLNLKYIALSVQFHSLGALEVVD